MSERLNEFQSNLPIHPRMFCINFVSHVLYGKKKKTGRNMTNFEPVDIIGWNGI